MFVHLCCHWHFVGCHCGKGSVQVRVPVASNIIGYAGATLYALLMFALLSCSRDASTRVVLIIAVTLFLGVCIGFLFALNVTLQSRGEQPEVYMGDYRETGAE